MPAGFTPGDLQAANNFWAQQVLDGTWAQQGQNQTDAAINAANQTQEANAPPPNVLAPNPGAIANTTNLAGMPTQQAPPTSSTYALPSQADATSATNIRQQLQNIQSTTPYTDLKNDATSADANANAANDRLSTRPTAAPAAGGGSAPMPGSDRFKAAEDATTKAGEDQAASIERERAAKQAAFDAHAAGIKYGAEYYDGYVSPYEVKYNNWKFGSTDPNTGKHVDGAYDIIMKQADARNANIQRQIAAVPDIDPKKAYVGGTFGQILAAISQGLGGFGAGMTHSRNFASDIINAAVDKNVEAQKANIDKQWKKISMDKDFAHDETAKGLFMVQKADDAKLAYLTNVGEQMKQIQATNFDTPEGKANLAAQLEPLEREKAKITQNTADRMLQYQTQEYHEAQAASNADPRKKLLSKYDDYVTSVEKQNTEHRNAPVAVMSLNQFMQEHGGAGTPAPDAYSDGGKTSSRILLRIADAQTAIEQLQGLGGSSLSPEKRAAAETAGGAIKSLAKELNLGDDKSLAWLNSPADVLQFGNQARLQALKVAISEKQARLQEAAGKAGVEGGGEGGGGGQ